MGLEISKALGVGAIQPNIYINRNKFSAVFSGDLYSDKFESYSLERYTSEPAIRKMINANPKIKNLVKDFNPELNLNMQELEQLLAHHATDTKNICIGITQNLPFSLQTKVNSQAIESAAYLHDLGKVFIPREILNKPAKLSEAETQIMHKHSQLSYELLKNTNLDKKTLNLIRNHHQNAQKTGYPLVGNDFNADLDLQILSTADKYSALTETRTYKAPMNPKEALTIIYQDVKEGKLHPFVFKALVNYANNTVTNTQAIS